MGTVENVDLSATRPSEYLREGLLSPEGKPREGLNGQHSLGMAHRLKLEGTSQTTVLELLESLRKASERLIPKDADNTPLKEASRKALDTAWSATGPAGTGVLGELRVAVLPWVKDTRTLAAMLLHVERIARQLGLVSTAPPPKA
ncbi:hypothetical protein D7V97_18435 [Corallococcus sp. CA053C]|uniref:hypothetical protein n=1 Tax=Corallococcus sp. CA053C TaxID=2316732 RepID=UPI000EA2A099|nr:hypothetical protein [Corallococcus sp. CA053C]RKH08778.1 hypothetical protein D7V97_18435 [Corallococcus sp. CA053C]